MTSNSYET